MGVAARLLLDDALAAGLTPARVLGAPGGDVNVAGAAAGAAGGVGLVGGTESNGESKEENKDLLEHFFSMVVEVFKKIMKNKLKKK